MNNVPSEQRVTESERFILKIKQVVEATVENGYYPEVMSAPSARIPAIAAFTEHWKEDEAGHDASIGKVLDATGRPIPYCGMPYRQTSRHWFKLLTRKAGEALPMALGFLNEAVTYAVYVCMARNTKNPTLRSFLLDGVAKEELPHRMFYGGTAAWLLNRAPVAQATVRAILSRRWNGVGADVISWEHSTFMMRHIFTGNEKYFSKTVGDLFRRLPGMKNFYAPELLLKSAGLNMNF